MVLLYDGCRAASSSVTRADASAPAATSRATSISTGTWGDVGVINPDDRRAADGSLVEVAPFVTPTSESGAGGVRRAEGPNVAKQGINMLLLEGRIFCMG